jgi:hypothetical protein
MKISSSKLLLASAFLLGTASCSEDRLVVEPVGEYLSENFYATEAQVYAATVAAYDPLSWSMAFGQWISPVMYASIRSDNANAGGDPSNNDQPAWQELDDFRETEVNTVLQPLYRRNYVGIFRANLVINNSKVSTPAVRRYQAEAKFLRAYYHFELFKYFGPVPVVTEVLAPSEVGLTRNTMSELFGQVVKDLEEAIDELPATLSAAEAGRASRGAAQALLGKAYLYWADLANDDAAKFDKAAEHLRAVVNSGQYQLADDYKSLFAFGAKNPAESVFELQHTNLTPSDWGWFEGISGNGVVQLCGIRGLCQDHPSYQEGWGFMLPTESLYNHFLSDDTYRRRASMVSAADLQQELVDAGVNNCSTPVDITQNNPVDFTGYWQVKYANFKAYAGNNVNGGDPNLTKDANVYAIRYADVLLMLAEALHRGSGSDAEAMGYVDQVRERAAGPGDNTGNFRTVSQLMADQGWSLLDAIWYERRSELAFEGDRWHDLVRSGRATAALFAGDPLRGGNFSEQRLWLPISFTEISVAPSLTTYPDASLFQ